MSSSAYLTLLETHGSALRRLAGCYTDHGADREDLFQEIALALWLGLPRFRGESSERTWLYRVAHNVAITFVARARRKAAVEEPDPEAAAVVPAAENAEEAAIRRERAERLRWAIRMLPVVDRQIIQMHLEGLSHAEIETVTGLSQGNIAVRLSRIRQRLREMQT